MCLCAKAEEKRLGVFECLVFILIGDSAKKFTVLKVSVTKIFTNVVDKQLGGSAVWEAVQKLLKLSSTLSGEEMFGVELIAFFAKKPVNKFEDFSPFLLANLSTVERPVQNQTIP